MKVSPENLLTINCRVYVKESERQIIENVNKYSVCPVRACHCLCERGTFSRFCAFSAEPLPLALIKVHRIQFLLKKSVANCDLKLGQF